MTSIQTKTIGTDGPTTRTKATGQMPGGSTTSGMIPL